MRQSLSLSTSERRQLPPLFAVRALTPATCAVAQQEAVGGGGGRGALMSCMAAVGRQYRPGTAGSARSVHYDATPGPGTWCTRYIVHRYPRYYIRSSTLRACPGRIEIVNRKSKSTRFRECFGRGVQTEPNMKREMHPKNIEELQPTGRTKLCTHADNLALGNTDPPEQQAYTTTFRPREVVGHPMEVMARPTLTPRDQNSNYTENEVPASISRASC